VNEGLPYPGDFAEELTRELWARIKAGAVTGARPRKAATLMIVDAAGAEPRVLMGKRNAAHKFMPGRFVFPGGRVEPGDRAMAASGALHANTEASLMACLRRPTAGGARALAMAAIRETFEETGLLIGDAEHGAPENPPPGAWAEFASHGVFPGLEDIHFVGRAVTPPRNKLRFDTFFLAADAGAIAKRVEGKVGPDRELVELAWATIPEALEIGAVPITKVLLRELANRLARGMDRRLPAPVYATGRVGWTRVLA
jgi:8-oxo-dGTP pyrophosphatase MutT (NUDIX family)